jgi:hypothetical protein
MITSDFFILSFLIAILAFVYVCILAIPGEVFGKINNFLYLYFKNNEREQAGMFPHPIYKLLIGCEKCIAGQIALWSFLVKNWTEYTYKLIFTHVLFVGLTIFITVIIKSIYKRYIE